MEYIISPATIYDEDELLWYTKVGTDVADIPLHYTVWGKTKEESRKKAERLVKLLGSK